MTINTKEKTNGSAPGFTVHWSEVDSYKHPEANVKDVCAGETILPKASTLSRKYNVSDEELTRIGNEITEFMRKLAQSKG